MPRSIIMTMIGERMRGDIGNILLEMYCYMKLWHNRLHNLNYNIINLRPTMRK